MTAYVIAMDSEAACVVAHLSGPVEGREYGRRVVRGTLCGESVLVVVSGVGKANAAAAAQFAVQSGASRIVNLGVSGGLGGGVAVGGVFEVARAVQYDFDLAAVNGTAPGVLDGRATPYFTLETTGRFPAKTLATGDRFNDETGDLPLLASLGAELRDMEGAAVAQVAEAAGVPCRAVKCVTNVVGAGATGQYRDNLVRCLARLSDAVASGL